MHFCMDWKAVNFDWNRARAFYVTVEEGSLSAAAKALDLSQPTLSRQVNALEQELKTVLFERVGKGLELTPTGHALHQHVKSMAEAAASFSLSAAGNESELEGLVRISATEMTAFFILPSIVKAFHYDYPKIQIDIIVSNESSDLKRREADIAIRAYRPEQPDLIIRKIKDLEVNLFASKTYVEQNKSIFEEGRLSEANYIGFGTNKEYAQILEQMFALQVDQKRFAAFTTNHLVNWQLVKQDLGISGMLCEVGENDPDIVAVFPYEKAVKGDLYLVSHRELRVNPRIKIVFDYFANALS